MVLKFTLLCLFVLSFGMACAGHDDHDEDQIPMGYVRFPYQATYPGDNSGQCALATLLGNAF
jgi:agmatinase